MNVFLVNVCVIVFLNNFFLIECTVQSSRVALMQARRFRMNFYYYYLLYKKKRRKSNKDINLNEPFYGRKIKHKINSNLLNKYSLVNEYFSCDNII